MAGVGDARNDNSLKRGSRDGPPCVDCQDVLYTFLFSSSKGCGNGGKTAVCFSTVSTALGFSFSLFSWARRTGWRFFPADSSLLQRVILPLGHGERVGPEDGLLLRHGRLIKLIGSRGRANLYRVSGLEALVIYPQIAPIRLKIRSLRP